MAFRDSWIEKRKSDTNRSQMHYARQGIVTEEMNFVAVQERLAPEFIRDEVAVGRLVICANTHHPNLRPIGIGVGVSARSPPRPTKTVGGRTPISVIPRWVRISRLKWRK